MEIIGKAAIAGVLLAAVTSPVTATVPQPFKITNIHFETNASACDMGIQISFDTGGLTEGLVEGPQDQVVFSFRTLDGQEGTHDITEGFQERVEPPITDLQLALGCEPSEGAIPLSELLQAWPAGVYDFEGRSGAVEYEGAARLNHRVPAGPKIVAPKGGRIVAHDADLQVRWLKVTGPILPTLGPVEVVGYHVLVVDVTNPVLPPGRTKTSFDADVSKRETTFLVPKQYLEPGRIYELEILATERGGNQTITEGGVFCTPPIRAGQCVKP